MSVSIYHITSRAAWDAALAGGVYTADSYRAEGFIHCSTAAQVLRVANVWYRGVPGLVLLKIEQDKVSSILRWEPGTDKADELFPHLYAPLALEAVLEVIDLPVGADGTFVLPAGVD